MEKNEKEMRVRNNKTLEVFFLITRTVCHLLSNKTIMEFQCFRIKMKSIGVFKANFQLKETTSIMALLTDHDKVLVQ